MYKEVLFIERRHTDEINKICFLSGIEMEDLTKYGTNVYKLYSFEYSDRNMRRFNEIKTKYCLMLRMKNYVETLKREHNGK